ncbi:MAG: zinc-ribbon domain-containing protein, partial [Ilumatobacteraceae bacterium]|nr:zinc-ribbon domain-containing protein [Ilumatobacteraceae bacterium]
MACPSCGQPVPAGARFCPSCGLSLLDTSHDERRVVTVMFADVVGFTTLASTADPEHVKRLVDTTFERLVAVIERYGGNVDKVLGDAIVALFGAPVAHEDDPERAVRAALEMQSVLAGHDV